jgi:hypothetical protein
MTRTVCKVPFYAVGLPGMMKIERGGIENDEQRFSMKVG